MPQKTKVLKTNFTAGELSPRMEGRPDLAANFNGARKAQNIDLFPQGGWRRRFGTRFVQEVKDSTVRTYLFPFTFSVTDGYMLEYGDLYIRMFKADTTPIETAPDTPLEVVSPYTTALIPDLQTRQSADIMYHSQPFVAPYKLSRLNDLEWFLQIVNFRPPPSVEEKKETAFTITPAATTGLGIVFTTSGPVFLAHTPENEASDVGKQIVSGVSRAVIVSVQSTTQCTADIIDDFLDTNPIPADEWTLDGSPFTIMNVDDKAPVGLITKCFSSGVDAFRPEDVGKYIKVLGGVLRIVEYKDATEVRAQILAELVDSEKDNPPKTERGEWTLEVDAWTDERGWPECIEFHEGRLGYGGNFAQPTSWWLSTTDSYEDFAVGPLATSAVEYTIASRQVNQIEWLSSDRFLLIGTAGNEHTAKGSGDDEPLGGDVLPAVRPAGNEGAASIQALEVQDGSIFISKSHRRVNVMRHEGGQVLHPADLTLTSEHLFEAPLDQIRMGYAKDPDYQVYGVRSDGVLLVLTYRPSEEVEGWARWVTDGVVEAVATQRNPDGDRDTVWLIVNRTIDGVTKRYIEVVEDRNAAYASETIPNQGFQLDCATVFTNVLSTTITGLDYLEGKTVGYKQDGYDRGDLVVTGGQIVIEDFLATGSTVEVGLRYETEVETMRPAIDGENIEGVPRSWDKILLRLMDTIGGTVNETAIEYSEWGLFTGEVLLESIGWSRKGYVSIKQSQAYPMTCIMFAGELSYGDRMGGDYDS